MVFIEKVFQVDTMNKEKLEINEDRECRYFKKENYKILERIIRVDMVKLILLL